MKIGRTYRFEAAHHLPLVPTTHKCHNMHGHNYRVDVVICGELDGRGFVCDFAKLDEVAGPLVAQCDHVVLNSVDGLQNPTAEVIAGWFMSRLSETINGVASVRVYENDDCWAQLDKKTVTPGHTGLVVSPEAIDEALAANPLPEELANPKPFDEMTEEELLAGLEGLVPPPSDARLAETKRALAAAREQCSPSPASMGVAAEMLSAGFNACPTMLVDVDGRRWRETLSNNDLAVIYRAMHAVRPKREVTWEEVEQLYTDLDGHFSGRQAGDIENDIKRALQAFTDGRGL